ncbi:LLM class flavin-dependent oxidoreductase [Paenibacillus athensensis]|uniref:Luciferase-like domain-containing protein n=1 Tax=Paenibacillus athensensis TaxID=1967502 RepID=A0A4Y8PUM1_9BACL|nr:LLM class flavin-dependent oxidoreductase [Paenibacillus athensensis]MCD1257240.1 LLM class flavin-dependent oxidoreductase [Paenibacillus athensensis]
MEFCWNLQGEAYADIVRQTQLADRHGFDAALIVSLQMAMDPWILATQLATQTERLRFLVAQNTNLVLPSYTAKAVNTLNLITGSRIDLNIVTGSSHLELGKEGNFERHIDRYRRTEEFVSILRMAAEESITFQGDYYRLNQFRVTPQAPPPRIFVAGSSPQALATAARYADFCVIYARDFAGAGETFATVKQQAQAYGRSIRCGLLIDVIARSASDEAWQAAEALSATFSRRDKKMKSLLLKTVDSVGIAEHKELLAHEDYRVDRHLWSGIAQISTAHGLSIVGSYREVIDTLRHYEALGADYFLLSGMAGDREIERLGEYVLPYVPTS